jgi:hypothetical protein
MKTLILLAAMGWALSGCTSLAQLDSTATAPGNDESVIVLGLGSDNYRISFFPGEVKDGHFRQSSLATAAALGGPQQGYFVAKVKAGQTIAITNVRYVKQPGDVVLGMNYTPCDDAPTIVLTVPRGKVIYLGAIMYRFEGKRLGVKFRDNLEGAQEYIGANFPALRGKLEAFTAQHLPTYTRCAS